MERDFARSEYPHDFACPPLKGCPQEDFRTDALLQEHVRTQKRKGS